MSAALADRAPTRRPAAAPSPAPVGVTTPEQVLGPDNGHQLPDRVAALLARARGGDREAFAQLYDGHVDLVYRDLSWRTGSRQLAEDLTSETFLRALRRIGAFTGSSSQFTGWLLTIGRNLLIDHYRSAAVRREFATDDLLAGDRPDDGIEDAVLGGFESATVRRAVRELPADQQDCLILRFLHEHTVTETAQLLHRSDGAIKQLQLRALRNLAKLLSNQVRC